jgi:hypothetical protein
MRAAVDSSGALLASDGTRFPPLEISAEMVLNRTTVIYGPSGTGKTVIAKHLLRVLKEKIPQCLVVSPSEPSNHSYDGIVDPPFIHYRLGLPSAKPMSAQKAGLEFFNEIWKRQTFLTELYTKANRIAPLEALFRRLPKSSKRRGVAALKAADALRRKALAGVAASGAPPGLADDKSKKINEKYEQMRVLIYKTYITPEYTRLWDLGDLSADERLSLNYIGLNPNFLLVLDDCAADLKPFFRASEFTRYFYQARHAAITLILIAQDDTDLPPNLRKNVFLSIFTDPISCRSNFDRPSNGFTRETRGLVGEMLPLVFAGNRKLVYIRDDPRRQNFYHFEAPYPTPFTFGSSASRELCRLLRADEGDLDDENPYYEHFIGGSPKKIEALRA